MEIMFKDINEALNALAETIKGREDFRYRAVWEQCVYVDYDMKEREDGTWEYVPVAPRCLVGAVLWDKGVIVSDTENCLPVTDLFPWANEEQAMIIGALNQAQGAQDSGLTWGEALMAARIYVAEGFAAAEQYRREQLLSYEMS